MTTIPAGKARNHFSEVLNKVARGRERTIVTRRGKRVAAIVSIADLELLENALCMFDYRADVEYCRQALNNLDLTTTIAWVDSENDLSKD